MAEQSTKTSIKKYDESKTSNIIPNYLSIDTTTQHHHGSPPSSQSIPTSPVGLRKSASIRRYNCLCSPTTHAGSFRCRHHRNSGLTRTSMSVGSKLSELAAGKSATAMCDNGVSHIGLMHGKMSSSPSSSTYLPA